MKKIIKKVSSLLLAFAWSFVLVSLSMAETVVGAEAPVGEVVAEDAELSSDGEVLSGEAEVTGYGYTVSVAVVIGPEGEIVSVSDDGTVPGNSDNEFYWGKVVGKLGSFEGVIATVEDVEAVDAITGATSAWAAAKAAVVDAVSKSTKDYSGVVKKSDSAPVVAESEPEALSGEIFALMNIPYAKFYEAEAEEEGVNVDAVTAATAMAYAGECVQGAYHDGEGSMTILGVTYPIYVSDASLLEDCVRADSEDALTDAGDYAFVVLEETPASYKELTLEDNTFAFGKATAEIENLDDLSVEEVTVSTRRGDYEIDFGGTGAETLMSCNAINGVVLLVEKDGNTVKLPLRHLENIFVRSEDVDFALFTGHNNDVYGQYGLAVSGTSHYPDLEGATIVGIIWYVKDAEGVYRVYQADEDIFIDQYPEAIFTDDHTITIVGLTDEIIEEFSQILNPGTKKEYRSLVTVRDSEGNYLLGAKEPGTEKDVLFGDLEDSGVIVLEEAVQPGETYTVDIVWYRPGRETPDWYTLIPMEAVYEMNE